jgi:chromosome segregation ATPase
VIGISTPVLIAVILGVLWFTNNLDSLLVRLGAPQLTHACVNANNNFGDALRCVIYKGEHAAANASSSGGQSPASSYQPPSSGAYSGSSSSGTYSDSGSSGSSSSGAQAASNQAAQQQLQADAQNVSSDIQNTNADRRQLGGGNFYASALSTESQDVRQTRSDMRQVLREVGRIGPGVLCTDAATVQTDVAQVQTDVASVQSDQAESQGDSSQLSAALTQLKQDGQTLQADENSAGSGGAGNIPAVAVVQNAIRQAQATLASANSASNRAIGQANAMEKQAAGYQSRSDRACTAAGG